MSYRFSLDRRRLATVVRRAARLIGGGLQAFDHSGVWITVEDGWLTVASTRPPVTLLDRIRVDGSGAGSLVVPIGPLRDVVLSRRSGEAELEGDEQSLSFRSRAFTAELRAIALDSVLAPAGPVQPQEQATVGGIAFRDGLDHTALSLGHHHAWTPRTEGLEITIEPGGLRLAATNLETLAIADIRDPDATATLDEPVVVPGEGLDALGRFLPAHRRAQIRRDARQVDVVAGDTEVRINRLLDPLGNYEQLRRGSTTRAVATKVSLLQRSLKRVAALPPGNSPARVWLRVEPDTITTRTLDRQVGSGSDTCKATLEGEPCEVGLHLWTLVACLRQLKAPDLAIEIGDPTKRLSLYSTACPQRRYHLIPLAIDPPPDA